MRFGLVAGITVAVLALLALLRREMIQAECGEGYLASNGTALTTGKSDTKNPVEAAATQALVDTNRQSHDAPSGDTTTAADSASAQGASSAKAASAAKLAKAKGADAASPLAKKAQVPGDWAKQARAQLVRPADFKKLTAELKRKQALAAGLDEAAVQAELEKRALAGDVDAALTLGLMLRYGDGASDKTQGAEMIRAAAEAGNTRAMAEWGRILLADDANIAAAGQADGWLRRAWAAGESEAGFLLASAQRLGLLDSGAGDDSTAMLLAAAEKGNDSARRLLIAANKQEQFAGLTSEQLRRWRVDLANDGDVQAMNSLALQSRKNGDNEAAIAWLQRAAANGSAEATLSLAAAGIGDQQVQLAAIDHLRTQLSSPTTADSQGRFTLAFLLTHQPESEANRNEILGLLREVAGENHYQAKLAAGMIEGGSSPRAAMAAMAGMDDSTAYVRNAQKTFAEQEQAEAKTGELQNARPRPLDVPAPQFPVELFAARTEGQVMVQFIVDETGAVRDPQVLTSDHPAFSAAALEAISRWRFTPGVKDGKAVATRTKLAIPFRPQK